MNIKLISLSLFSLFCLASDQSKPAPLAFESLSELKQLIKKYRLELLPKKLPPGNVFLIIEAFLKHFESELKITPQDTYNVDVFWRKRRNLLNEWKSDKRQSDKKLLIELRDLPELKNFKRL